MMNDRLTSTPWKEFEGDIIITDPCYVVKGGDWNEKCAYGAKMEALGFTNYLTHDTIYGDWGCTVYDNNSGKVLGEFCADAGLVSVFLLDEVLKYNPKYHDHIDSPWTTTLIRNFKGSVKIVVDKISDINYEAYVLGEGVDTVTGMPINFYSEQTDD